MSPEIQSILAQLQEADTAYYNSGVANLTDASYDALRDRLRLLDPSNPYFSTVGAPAAEHMGKVLLSIHMGSQEKAKTVEEATTWARGVATELVASDKLDGSSIEVTYVNGYLTRAATRGDGVVGSDVTKSARQWSNLPQTIPSGPGIVTVRGEAMFPISVWKDVIKAIKPDSVNPRNEANGTVIGGEERNRYITLTAFDIEVEGINFTALTEKFAYLQKLGFTVVRHKIIGNIPKLIEYQARCVECRPFLDYECDGLVLAVNNLQVSKALGYSNGGSCPRGQIAWKYESSKALTTVIGMTITQGHTGAIVPTAKLEPIFLAGVTVSNTLLNNFEYIKELNLNIGDVVEVERAGDVIPHITKVVQKNSEGPYPAPTVCPSCAAALVTEGRITKCVNEDCESLSFQRVRNWVNKLDIKQFGDALLEALMNVENPLVKDIPDLYKLKASDLASLTVGNGAFGDSMAEKVMKEIDKTRTITTDLMMGSLSIKFLGRSMARHIGLEMPSDYLMIPVIDLAAKDNMGINKAREMSASVKTKAPLIAKIMEVVTVKPFVKAAPVIGGGLSGVSVCFTGVRMTAEEKAKFEAAGGVEKSGVSAGLTYLVQKDAASESSKSTKAKSLGIKVIGIDEFRTML